MWGRGRTNNGGRKGKEDVWGRGRTNSGGRKEKEDVWGRGRTNSGDRKAARIKSSFISYLDGPLEPPSPSKVTLTPSRNCIHVHHVNVEADVAVYLQH